jgi:hypothetical protein
MRYIAVTIDTEVNRSQNWAISNPVSFSSVTEGIPNFLAPLFAKFDARPTYLVSPEVLEDAEACAVLREQASQAELGTHLHAQFIDPERELFPEAMAGRRADGLQTQLTEEVERRKLQNLTDLFLECFGFRPRSFRAGRFALGSRTLEFLSGLRYRVDSSVTPGLRWTYREGVVDYRTARREPHRVGTPRGDILEVPISVWAGSWLAAFIQKLPSSIQRSITLVLGSGVRFAWLRPSWMSGRELTRLVTDQRDRLLVMMFHSMEVIPGASPYAASIQDVRRLLNGLEFFLEHCVSNGFAFCGLADLTSHA